MEIKEYILQLTGKASLPEALNVGDNYKVQLEGSIITDMLSDNHDGTCDRIFKFKPIIVTTTDHLGHTLKAKDTRSMSQLLRGLLRKKWINAAAQIEEEDYYQKFMYGVMRDLDELVERYHPDL